MNWGKGIIIGMGLFMAFIIFLVVNLMMNRVDLESEDYYQREVDYQQEITAMNNSSELEASIQLLSQEKFVVVKVPDAGEFKNIEVQLLRPDDQKLDKSYSISGTKSYLIPKEELTKGQYNVEIRFESNSKQCLQKETIYI